MSIPALVRPATPSVMPPGSGEAARMSVTSCSVETLVGPSVGTTWKPTMV